MAWQTNTYGGRRNGSMYVSVENLKEVTRLLDQIAREDLNPAKRDLRQGTKDIANNYLIPALTMSAFSSGVPIAPAMAGTMRTRTDRFVTVRVGAVNPKGLRGFRAGVGNRRADARREAMLLAGRKPRGSGTSQSYRTTLAWGSERGPYDTDGTNHYAVPQNKRGYWVQPGVNAHGTLGAVRQAYMNLLDRILRDYGRYR